MMFFVFVLFLAGAFFIAIEAFTPHGVSAIFGLLLIVLSIVVAVYEAGPATGMLYAGLSLGTAAWLTYWAYTSGIRRMALPPEKEAEPVLGAEPTGKPAIGDAGRVVKPLRPTGEIEWNGVRFPARTLTPEKEAANGTRVVVRGQDSIFYLVEESEE